MKTPHVEKLRSKIVAGERRKAFLEKKIWDKAGTPTSLDYDRAEVAFIDAGIRALEFVEVFRHPDMSPIVALERLVEELDKLGLPNQSNDHDDLHKALVFARRTLRAVTEDG